MPTLTPAAAFSTCWPANRWTAAARIPSTSKNMLSNPCCWLIDLEAKAMTKLATLPRQPPYHMSLAPDGRALLLDLVTA
jgi:hypothetical protein